MFYPTQNPLIPTPNPNSNIRRRSLANNQIMDQIDGQIYRTAIK